MAISAQTVVLDHEAPGTTNAFTYFGNCDLDGAATTTVSNPAPDAVNGTANVGAFVRRDCSTTFAGGFGTPGSGSVDLTSDNQISIKVWMPRSGSFTLKLEGGGASANWEKTQAVTDTAQWVELIFDMTAGSDVAPFTAAAGGNYTTAVIFFDLGSAAHATDRVNYYDEFTTFAIATLDQIDLPITWDDPTVDYTVVDFGGNISSLATDPDDASNMVMSSLRPDAADFFAGTTMSDLTGLASAIPITNDDTRMQMRVYSPTAGTPVRLKVEDNGDPSKSVEAEVLTTVANAWETLIFDFANEVPGTQVLNPAFTFNKASVFFNFGATAGVGDATYLWDDIEFIGGGGGGVLPIELPLTFDDAAVAYSFIDFGGAATSVGADPVDPANNVAVTFRPNSAEFFAGTLMAGAGGLGTPIPLSATGDSATMTVRVYAPDTGLIVRFKIENISNPGEFIETDAVTSVANAWETLTFDFNNPNVGSPAINPAWTYNSPILFFNFNATGVGDQTFYSDDMTWVDPSTSTACDATDAPTGVSSTVNAGSVDLSWNPINNSVACEVQGGPVGGGVGKLRVFGTSLAGTTVPGGALSPATYEWRVRCACSIPPDPIDATPLSAADSFVWPAPRMGATEVSQTLFPNPANDLVVYTIVADAQEEVEVQITDMLGRVVMAQNFAVVAGSNPLQLDVTSLTEGTYFVNTNGQEAISFVVSH